MIFIIISSRRWKHDRPGYINKAALKYVGSQELNLLCSQYTWPFLAVQDIHYHLIRHTDFGRKTGLQCLRLILDIVSTSRQIHSHFDANS